MTEFRHLAFLKRLEMSAPRRTVLRLVAVAGLALATPASAAEAKALTVGDALNMLTALRNLDGRATVVKESVVMQPWDFGSGMLRLRIAKNVKTLTDLEKTTDEARQAIVKEIMKGMPAGKDGQPPQIQAGTPEFENFQKQYTDLLNQPAQVDLSRIRASELKLDKNEIPTTTLAALSPILDDDVSGK